MDRNDQLAIESLFGKLAAVERQSPPRDAQSEAFIRERIDQQPSAPYYMAQTIVVQQQALEAAQARIEELEAAEAPAADSGGLFGGLFGTARQPARSGSVPRVGRSGRLATPSHRASRLAAASSPARRRPQWAWPAAYCWPMRSAACSAPARRRQPKRPWMNPPSLSPRTQASTTPASIPAAISATWNFSRFGRRGLLPTPAIS